MNKVSSNASWSGLTSDQLKALDKWLFEEKQSYDMVLQKAQTQLGYKGSRSSLTRYFNRRRKERAIEEFRNLRDDVAAVNGAGGDPDAVSQASMKLLGMFVFQQLRQSPQNVKEAVSVARLIVQNDYNELLREVKAKEFELRRELKGEDQKIRREAMEFAKEKFQFDMIENGVKALPHLQRVAETMSDPDPTLYQERAIEARRAMFGPEAGVSPENEGDEQEAPEQPASLDNPENAAESKEESR